jgi:hypothetical protein
VALIGQASIANMKFWRCNSLTTVSVGRWRTSRSSQVLPTPLCDSATLQRMTGPHHTYSHASSSRIVDPKTRRHLSRICKDYAIGTWAGEEANGVSAEIEAKSANGLDERPAVPMGMPRVHAMPTLFTSSPP